MQLNQSWAARWAARVVALALIGAVLTAGTGALCIGAAGALVGWMFDLRSTPPAWDAGFLVPGAFLGFYLGAWSGIVGALAGGAAALTAAPSRFLAPLALLWRVAAGQCAGTVGALSCYFLLMLWLAQTSNRGFLALVESNVNAIIFGAPALMICGAIAGAFWKRAA